MEPLITIVTSVFNGADTIQQCINSVVSQTYQACEHIVIDGGSTDGTTDILSANSDRLAYWISENDNGIYDAWNKAIKHASGDWLIFLGCDDFLWDSEALARISETLSSAYPKHLVVYGSTAVVDENDKPINVLGKPWEEIKRAHFKTMCVPNPSTFYHKDVFKKYGVFDSSFRIAGDYEFSMRVLASETPLFVEDSSIAGFRVGGACNSIANNFKSLQELCRARRDRGYRDFPTALCLLYARAFVKAGVNTVLGGRALNAIMHSWRKRKSRGERDSLVALDQRRGK